MSLYRISLIFYFNPRTHVGCDAASSVAIGSTIGISIHAPTWGATPYEQGTWQVFRDFNPRTHVGCDAEFLNPCTNHCISIHAPTWGATPDNLRVSPRLIFQSTHPRGVRLFGTEILRTVQTFQSTHPRGVRPKAFTGGASGKNISIHAPTWGATS